MDLEKVQARMKRYPHHCDITVRIILEPSDECKRTLTDKDAIEVVQTALQCLINDGYEDKDVVLSDFRVMHAD